MKKLYFFLALILSTSAIFSQNYSNKGKEFWIAYTSHIDGTQSLMAIYITSDQNATGNIQVGTISIPFTVTANQVTKKILGSSGSGPVDGSNASVYLNQKDGIQTNAAIKVTSDVAVVVYAHIIRSARSAATLVLPTPVLGTEYVVPSYPSNGSSGGGDANIGEFAVVATQPNTTIEFTPTINGGNTKTAGSTYQVTLANAGDCYQFQGSATLDISGTVVKSISTSTTGCKPIAVFAGTTWSAFDCNNASGGDNLYQELFPVRSWGKKFITAPFIYRSYDLFRIYIKDPATVVNVTENGTTQNLTTSNYDAAHKFYWFKTGNPIYIDADQPISVVQFMTSTTCKTNCTTNSNSKTCHADPEMVVLNPVEQTLKDITFFSAHQNSFTGFSNITNVENHYVNIIIDKNHKSSLKIDGANPKGTFIDIPSTNYSYLQEDVTTSSATNPVHHVIADTGFSAIVYGTGRVESYGYNGGTNVLDLYQYISLKNQYATVNFPATCVDAPFHFSITLPYQPLKLNWDFGGNAALSPNTNVTNSSPVYDSSFVKDGKTLYVYKLAGTYKFNQVGTYPVKVLVNNPTTDGCNGDQEINYDVQVFPAPVANFTITTNNCSGNIVPFLDSSTSGGRDIIKYIWDFGDGTTDSIKNPTKTYSGFGNKNVRHSIITDIGCLADTVKTITLSGPPIAKFIVNDTSCASRTFTLIDSSNTKAPATIVKWYWDYGNGKKDTFTTKVNPVVSYTNAGQNTITLIVENSSGCTSNPASIVITTHDLPVVNFSLPEICLDDALAHFTDSSKIADGTQNLFTYNWYFGDKNASTANPNTSAVKNPTHSYSDTGYYQVKLVVTTNNFCVDSLTQSFTVNGSTPKANFAVLNNANLCSNDSVRIQNTSAVDFGNITKLEIYWDTANNLLHKTVDNAPQKNKVYSTTYNSFQQPATQIVYVKVYAYSGVSCVSEKTIAVTLHQSPKVQFLSIKSICKDANSRILTEATETGGVPGTSVFTGSGISNVSTGLFNPALVNVGSYSIKYTYTSNNFACIDSARQTITVLQSPVAKFGVSNPLCEKNNIILNDSSTTTVGTITNWKWDFGNNDSITKNNANSFAYQYASASTYSVTLKVTTDSGCSHSVTQAIAIHPLPKVNFTLPAIVCLPQGKAVFTSTSTIADNSQALFTYLWNFGDKNNSTTSSLAIATHNYSLLDSPFVKLIVTSKDGCSDSATKQLTTILPQPKAAFTLKPDSSICIYKTIDFTDKSNGKTSAIDKWNWNFGGLGSSTQPNPSFQFNDSGNYAVSLSIINLQGCVSDTAYGNVTINPYPVLDLPTQLTFIQGGLLTIKPLHYYGHDLSYYWETVPAGISKFMLDDTVLFAQVFPDDDMNYKLTITGSGNCSVSDVVKVVVLKAPNIPTAFSPNGDGINDKWIIEHLESYPGCSINVFDRYGRTVYQSRVGYTKPWDGTHNGSPLPIGTYYYIIDTKTVRGIFSGGVTILK